MQLSIVIVSYNTKEILAACLASVKKFSKGKNYEIIVVDNGSTDGSVEYLLKQKAENRKQKIEIIENDMNLGFSKANNQGIRIAQGQYVLLLNSDTELVEDSLSKMVGWMEDHKSVGVATCKLTNPDGSIQATGGYFPTLPRIFLWSTFLDDLPLTDVAGSYHPSPSYYSKERALDWVTGAFFLMRQEVKEKAGLLDEDFFMYVEELEYCYRIKKAGFLIRYVPITQIIHIGGASGVAENAVLGEFSNLKLFYSKHKNFVELVVLATLLKIAAILRIIVLGIILGKKDAVKIYAKTLV